jgi:pyruvate-ferredoxin/flavodoxin oxidoreductase
MNCRQTGFAMLSTANSQEIIDLAPVAHLAAVKGRIPFLHFFDGFRTSHEMSKVELIDYEDYARMLDFGAVDAFRAQALNPEHPRLQEFLAKVLI